MTTLNEGNLSFTFPLDWQVAQYDDWAFYRKQFEKCCCGNKAVDFLGYDTGDKTLWLIEVKDYRQFGRTKTIPLVDEIAIKVRDTLSGLFAAAKRGTVNTEQIYAKRALRATEIRVVLHLEQVATPGKMRAFDLADVRQQLKRTLKPIDPHPYVVELNTTKNLPWRARSIP